MKLRLHFAGPFLCRLATNPDPSDEPRGVSGDTFALVGEPDLDRVIRFQLSKAKKRALQRSFSPEVGVQVIRAERVADSGAVEEVLPSLVGAPVRLLPRRLNGRREFPKYQSGNDLLMEGGTEAIDPFRLRIGPHQGITIERYDPLDLERPDADIYQVRDADARGRRSSTLLVWKGDVVRRYRNQSGSFEDYFDKRISDLRARKREIDKALPSTTGAKKAKLLLERDQIDKRLGDLEDSRHRAIRLVTITMTETQTFALRGPGAIVLDAKGSFTESVDTNAPWPFHLWMGGWDSDLLQGFAHGWLDLPLRAPEVKVAPPPWLADPAEEVPPPSAPLAAPTWDVPADEGSWRVTRSSLTLPQFGFAPFRVDARYSPGYATPAAPGFMTWSMAWTSRIWKGPLDGPGLAAALAAYLGALAGKQADDWKLSLDPKATSAGLTALDKVDKAGQWGSFPTYYEGWASTFAFWNAGWPVLLRVRAAVLQPAFPGPLRVTVLFALSPANASAETWASVCRACAAFNPAAD